MTKQEYYDLLVRSARDGTFPAVKRRRCVYRHPENSKKRCAVGLLIPDNLYKTEFENESVDAIPDEVIQKILPTGLTSEDLRMIQTCHDNHAVSFKALSPWVSDHFIKDLNKLSCFADVKKKEIK